MKIELDKEDDVLYLVFDGSVPIADSTEVVPGIVVDYDSQDVVVGIEILNISKMVAAKQLERVDFKKIARSSR